MLHQKLIIKSAVNNQYVPSGDQSLELFSEVMSSLQQQKLIRKRPEKVRETFKIV